METKYYKDRSGKWRWRITAENNEIVGSSSQGFASKQKCKENLNMLKECLKEKNTLGK